jgi:outer membrane protein assembly factor BamB
MESEHGRARPTILPVDEGAFVVRPGTLSLLTSDLASEQWSTAIDEVSSFAVTDSRVWYPEAYERASSHVRTFNRTSGKEETATRVEFRGGLIRAVADCKIAVVANPDRRELVGCEMESGNVRWSIPFHARGAVAIGSRVVVTSADLRLVPCLDAASGKEVWRFAVPRAHEYSRLSPTEGVTVVAADEIVLALDDGPLFRLDAGLGEVTAGREVQGRPGAIHVTETEAIYLWLDGVVAIDHRTMQETWRLMFPDDVAALYGRRPPSVCGAHVASHSAVWTTTHGVVMAAGWDANGRVSVWHDELPGAVFPLGEGPTVHAGHVYVSPVGGMIGGCCYRSVHGLDQTPA